MNFRDDFNLYIGSSERKTNEMKIIYILIKYSPYSKIKIKLLLDLIIPAASTRFLECEVQ